MADNEIRASGLRPFRPSVLPSSLKIGFVGPGGWGKRVAASLYKAGAKIPFHARESTVPVSMLGKLVSIERLFEAAVNKEIDAIVSTAPPAVTRRVFGFCRLSHVPALLTKPLHLREDDVMPTAHTIVDYVRLWAPQYQKIKEVVRQHGVKKIAIDMFGHGPFRRFSGLWDYGPHALAFLFDLVGTSDFVLTKVELTKNRRDHGVYYYVEGSVGGIPFEMATGNGSAEATCRMLCVTDGDCRVSSYEEMPGWVRVNTRGDTIVEGYPDSLDRMTKSFVANVSAGVVDLGTLKMTVEIEKALKAIEAAGH